MRLCGISFGIMCELITVHAIVFIFYFVHRGTEEVFQVLEDNQVTLSTMKASRFVKAFEQEVHTGYIWIL